ncbi:MAG: hypothetical protein R3C53_04640 [Pirellulaceae bacterium]
MQLKLGTAAVIGIMAQFLSATVAKGQLLDVIGGGVAVYHDGDDGPEYRAGGAELILVGGRFSGPLGTVPVAEIDRDVTASVSQGYRPKEEGIFHFFGQHTFANRDASKAVSIVYSLRNIDSTLDPVANPRFFSHVFYPKVDVSRRRVSLKISLELWPTARKIGTASQLQSILLGIIRVRTDKPLIEQKESPRDLMLEEIRMAVALLPEVRETRQRIIEEVLQKLPDDLREKSQELDVDLAQQLEIHERQHDELYRREAKYWEVIRAERPEPN